MKDRPLTLYELNSRVRAGIASSLPGACWVQAELSDVRPNASGHCYLEFIQKEPKGNRLVAKARGVIWSNVYHLLKPYFEAATGQALAAGIQVLVKVTAGFHELHGFSLTVTDIDPTYTLGDMARRRREILSRLQAEGVLSLNKELTLPLLARRIAVISSATAAGYGDFCDQLEQNPYGFAFRARLFPAVMQGERTAPSIIAALNAVNDRRDDWDVVVIIRGGGATSDLSGFDTYDLAANCAQFPLPIITGIGHERDDTVIDSVAYMRVKTPTAAAEFLINHLHDTAETLESHASAIRQIVSTRMEREKTRLLRLVERIPMQARARLKDAHYRRERLAKRLETALRTRLADENHRMQSAGTQLKVVLLRRMAAEQHRLALLEQQVKTASPEHLLRRGYSITRKNGKAVTDALALQPGDELTTLFARGEIKSRVTKP